MNPSSIWIAESHAEFVSRVFAPLDQNIIRSTATNPLRQCFDTERRGRAQPSARHGSRLAQKLPSKFSTRETGQRHPKGSKQGAGASTSSPRPQREAQPINAATLAGGRFLMTLSPRLRRINGLQFWRNTIFDARIAESNFQKNCQQRKIMSPLYRRADTTRRKTSCLRASHATAERGTS